MQFVVIAHDGTDAEAPERRRSAREAHLAGARRLKDADAIVTGGAVLDEAGAMTGSVLIVDFETRAELDAWLASDPYVTGDVWRRIDVHPFRVAV
ncbi:MAG: YciI family protein [Rhodospirillales bacterium]|jgi:hypothetical protein|nr:YciI family protein [Rhodospirillales bacterium]